MFDSVQKYMIEVILGGSIAWISKTVINLKKKNYATQCGVKALLRDRIIAKYELYIDKGYIPIYARENINELYKEYKALGGNGVIDDLINELFSLPTK